MQNNDEIWDNETGIDAEVWLQALLAISGDKERRAEVIQKICEKTGQTPEKVELTLSTLLNYLAGKTLSN